MQGSADETGLKLQELEWRDKNVEENVSKNTEKPLEMYVSVRGCACVCTP